MKNIDKILNIYSVIETKNAAKEVQEKLICLNR